VKAIAKGTKVGLWEAGFERRRKEKEERKKL